MHDETKKTPIRRLSHLPRYLFHSRGTNGAPRHDAPLAGTERARFFFLRAREQGVRCGRLQLRSYLRSERSRDTSQWNLFRKKKVFTELLSHEWTQPSWKRTVTSGQRTAQISWHFDKNINRRFHNIELFLKVCYSLATKVIVSSEPFQPVRDIKKLKFLRSWSWIITMNE